MLQGLNNRGGGGGGVVMATSDVPGKLSFPLGFGGVVTCRTGRIGAGVIKGPAEGRPGC